jgi:hypothetical protein
MARTRTDVLADQAGHRARTFSDRVSPWPAAGPDAASSRRRGEKAVEALGISGAGVLAEGPNVLVGQRLRILGK